MAGVPVTVQPTRRNRRNRSYVGVGGIAKHESCLPSPWPAKSVVTEPVTEAGPRHQEMSGGPGSGTPWDPLGSQLCAVGFWVAVQLHQPFVGDSYRALHERGMAGGSNPGSLICR